VCSSDLVWDDDGRLVDVIDSGVNQHSTYDAAGLRVRRKGSQSDTIFSSPYYDLENGTQGIKHIFAGDLRVASKLGKYTSTSVPIADTKPGTAYYFHLDHLGSTAVLTAQDASVVQSLETFVDGETWIDRAPQKPINGYLFNGKPMDPATGFYDYGQRFYDPRTSQWLGVDSALTSSPEKAVLRPSVLAAVGFSAHNPLRYIDPDGNDIVIRTENQDRINQVQNSIQKIVGKEASIGVRLISKDRREFGVEVTVSRTKQQEKSTSQATKDVIELITSQKLVVIQNIDPRNAKESDRATDNQLADMFKINASSPGAVGHGGAATINRDPTDQGFFKATTDGKTSRLIDSLIVIDYQAATRDVLGKLGGLVSMTDSAVTGHELVHARQGYEKRPDMIQRERRARQYENKYLRDGLGAREDDPRKTR
jgi:RHS repeat-associated protein